MSEARHGRDDARADTGAPGDGQLGVLLACFDGKKAAGKARRSLDTQLRSQGDVLLGTDVVEVDANHKASTHDPRRELRGTLTPALTWGVFGLVLGSAGVESAIVWAVIGAICGGLYTHFAVRHTTKTELARIGGRLPAQSSALAMWVQTKDARRLLQATASHRPAVASAAAISADLTARVFAGPADPEELPPGDEDHPLARDHAAVLSMILLRYPSPDTAKQIASQMAPKTKKAVATFDVELVIRTDRNGHRHVTDPKLGVAAIAKSDMLSWGGFGLVLGAIAGAVQGGGILGFIHGGLVTAVIWGLFGLGAGTLYGLWAGRSVSARQLKNIGPLLAPGTSLVLAWAGEPVTQGGLDAFTTPGSQQLVLAFNSVEHGAVLEPT